MESAIYIIFQRLFPYIAVIYLLECLAHVQKHHIVFWSYFRRRFRITEAGWHILPLLPFSQAYYCNRNLMVLGAKGLCFAPQIDLNSSSLKAPEAGRFVPYPEIRQLAVEETKVIVNGKVLANFPSGAAARKVFKSIMDLKSLSAEERPAALNSVLKEATDINAVANVYSQNEEVLRDLRLFSSLFFLILFILSPIIAYSELRFSVDSRAVTLVLLVSYLAAVIQAFFCYGRLKGTDKNSARLSTILTILSPVSSLHIARELGKTSLTQFHFATVAASLLPADDFRRLMRWELMAIKRSRDLNTDAIFDDWWALQEHTLDLVLIQNKLTRIELFATPPKKEPSAAKYCPICQAEYEVSATQCTGCLVDLVEFSEPIDIRSSAKKESAHSHQLD